MAIMTTTKFDECSRRYAEMELQSCLANITGDVAVPCQGTTRPFTVRSA
jgi:hypothetical protein